MWTPLVLGELHTLIQANCGWRKNEKKKISGPSWVYPRPCCLQNALTKMPGGTPIIISTGSVWLASCMSYACASGKCTCSDTSATRGQHVLHDWLTSAQCAGHGRWPASLQLVVDVRPILACHVRSSQVSGNSSRPASPRDAAHVYIHCSSRLAPDIDSELFEQFVAVAIVVERRKICGRCRSTVRVASLVVSKRSKIQAIVAVSHNTRECLVGVPHLSTLSLPVELGFDTSTRLHHLDTSVTGHDSAPSSTYTSFFHERLPCNPSPDLSPVNCGKFGSPVALLYVVSWLMTLYLLFLVCSQFGCVQSAVGRLRLRREWSFPWRWTLRRRLGVAEQDRSWTPWHCRRLGGSKRRVVGWVTTLHTLRSPTARLVFRRNRFSQGTFVDPSPTARVLGRSRWQDESRRQAQNSDACARAQLRSNRSRCAETSFVGQSCASPAPGKRNTQTEGEAATRGGSSCQTISGRAFQRRSPEVLNIGSLLKLVKTGFELFGVE